MNDLHISSKKTKKWMNTIIFLGFNFLLSFSLFQAHAQKTQQKTFHFEQKQKELISPKTLSQKVENLLFDFSNQERTQKKLVLLKKLPIIKKAAHDHSQDMLSRRYLSHFSPEKKSVLDRVSKYAQEVKASLGENLHSIQSQKGLTDPEAIAKLMMQDWMASPSHRKNILAKHFTRMEIACVSSWTEIYCSQVFASEGL